MFIFVVSFSIALVVSACCSIAESVLLSLSTAQIAEIYKRNPKVSAIWENLKKDVNVPITAILTLNTSAHTIGASFAGASFAELTGNRWVGAFSLVFTFMMLQFTEILPKTLGVRYTRQLAVVIARPLFYATKIGRPVYILFQMLNSPFEPSAKRKRDFSTSGLERKSTTAETLSTTVKEIQLLTSHALNKRQIDGEQELIITHALKLSQTVIRDVMVTMSSVSVISDSVSLEEALRIAHKDSHTRFPVCMGDNRARIIGYVNVKELVVNYNERRRRNETAKYGQTDLESFNWTSDLVHRISKFPPSARASDVLNQLVRTHQHIAFVSEGTVAYGILTLEDLVEKLLGNIEDEFDLLSDKFVQRNANTLEIGGAAKLDDVVRELSNAFGDDADEAIRALSPGDETISDWYAAAYRPSAKLDATFSFGCMTFRVMDVRRGKVALFLASRHVDASRDKASESRGMALPKSAFDKSEAEENVVSRVRPGDLKKSFWEKKDD